MTHSEPADPDPLPSHSFAAIITAAGSSSRFGTGDKKEYLPLPSGEPVLRRTLRTFLESGLFGILVLTVPRGHREKAAEIVSPLHSEPPVRIIEGGETRQDSVRAALEYLEGKGIVTVLVHDGARPWVSPDLITAVLEKTRGGAGAAPVIAPVDALKRIDGEGRIVGHEDRNRIMQVQTPQGFPYAPLLAAHREAFRENVTCFDDTEIFTRTGGIVYTVPGERDNKKITYPRDMEDGAARRR